MSIFIGTVIGTAMQKTAKVEVNRMFLHPHVLKYIRRRKVVFADNRQDCIVGDVVLIKSCPPISKKKHFTIHEVVAQAPRYNATKDTPPDSSETAEVNMTADIAVGVADEHLAVDTNSASSSDTPGTQV